jgi:hypothetical protein
MALARNLDVTRAGSAILPRTARSALMSIRVIRRAIASIDTVGAGSRMIAPRVHRAHGQGSQDNAPLGPNRPIAQVPPTVRNVTSFGKLFVRRSRTADPRSKAKELSIVESGPRPTRRYSSPEVSSAGDRAPSVSANRFAMPKRLTELRHGTIQVVDARQETSSGGARRFDRTIQMLVSNSAARVVAAPQAGLIRSDGSRRPIRNVRTLSPMVFAVPPLVLRAPANAESPEIRRSGGSSALQFHSAFTRRPFFRAPLSQMAPALTAVPSRGRGAEPERPASVVINSTPTVVINSEARSDIEDRVIEALRRHREMLFEQWQREAQRRRRMDF